MKPRIRASELDRILSCPGSRILNELIDRPQGDDGHEGSMIHWEIAWRIVREMGGFQPEGGLLWPEGVPKNYKIPVYSQWIVDWCYRCLSHIPNNWVVETETALEWEFDRFILSGHIDVPCTSPDGKESDDFDWKTGIIPVDPADNNWQVSGYMVLRRLIYGIEKAKFTIAQPRNEEEEGFQRISEVTIEGVDKLDSLVATLEGHINLALDSLLLESGKQCKYCVGMDCPNLQRLKDSMKTLLTPEMLANVKRTHSDGELVDLFAEARVLTKPIEDLKEQLAGRLAGGKTAQGASGLTARVVEQAAGYNVVDAPGMFNWLSEQMKPAEMSLCLSYPSGKIRDGLAKALNIPKDGKADVTAKSVFEGAAAAYLEPKTKRILTLA